MSTWQPKIVVFMCQWCLKSDSDWAQRFECPPGVRAVEVPCIGRINPMLVMSTLQLGADGILIVGCEPGRCHYKEGNYLGRRKLATLKSFLEYVGLEDERVRLFWLGDADRGKLEELIGDLCSQVDKLGPIRELATRAAAQCPAST